MNTFAYLWQYLAEYFLEWEMFQIKFIEKNQHRHLMPDNFFFFQKSCRLWDNVEKYGKAKQAANDNMAHTRYMLQ